MDANTLSPKDLFDGRVFFEIPPFQRPYVWTEEDQWQPLWDDLARVSECLLEAGEDEAQKEAIASHFLGAVVLKQLPSAAGDPTRNSVIDGQQRLLTLQIVLDAAHSVVEQLGDEGDSESLLELVSNSSKRFEGTPRRFKLWPSRIDRAAFEDVMDDSSDDGEGKPDSRISQAHRFFKSAIRSWCQDGGPSAVRLAALADVLQQRLQLVAINLGPNDDDQLIFETLNDRGTPLLAADLIKNFVFQRAEELSADVDAWSSQYWVDLDGEWWREQVSQGRLYRSRIDLFLQYWLTLRRLTEIPTEAVFRQFRNYASEHMTDAHQAEGFLKGLRRDADTFRELTELSPDSSGGSFYHRVVEALELGAFIPLLIWMISDNHRPPKHQVDKALAAVESWAVRRTLLRRTMKDVNKLVVAILQELSASPLSEVGDVTVAFLSRQTADARSWPTDAEVCLQLPLTKVYGNIKQPRIRAILSAVEGRLRSDRHEQVTLPTKLEIEHVMPRGWRAHWGEGVTSDSALSAERERAVNTIGNLTLVTQKLNLALSNRPWTDAEAALVAPTGPDAGIGKRSLLNRYSILLLNKVIVDDHLPEWRERDILERSNRIATIVTEIWPRG